MSVFGVILVRIFPHLDWIRRNTEYLFVFSPNMGKCGQNNSKYGHFLRSVYSEVFWEELFSKFCKNSWKNNFHGVILSDIVGEFFNLTTNDSFKGIFNEKLMKIFKATVFWDVCFPNSYFKALSTFLLISLSAKIAII